jgi:predicted MPP superfamily phosphohydrolase
MRQALAAPEAYEREVRLPRLPAELDGLVLVQVSDMHASPLLHGGRVRAVVEKINALRPDIVVLTGDIADGLPGSRADDIVALRELRAQYGVFACAGNHEYYADFDAWMRTYPRLGVRMLLNSHAVLDIRGRPLVLAGITDVAAERFARPLPDIGAALAGAPADAPRILLSHRPSGAADNARAGVNLQLSGHTHGGQILGLNRLVARLNEGYLYGWYQVGGMALYVSPGAGLWSGFPVRLGVPAEIARIVLRRG